MSVHTSHPDIIKRLKRAAGHLKSTIQMLEDEKPCLDIAQRLFMITWTIVWNMPWKTASMHLTRRSANLKR